MIDAVGRYENVAILLFPRLLFLWELKMPFFRLPLTILQRSPL